MLGVEIRYCLAPKRNFRSGIAGICEDAPILACVSKLTVLGLATTFGRRVIGKGARQTASVDYAGQIGVVCSFSSLISLPLIGPNDDSPNSLPSGAKLG